MSRYETVKRELRKCPNCKHITSHVIGRDKTICTFCGNVTLHRLMTPIITREEVIRSGQ